APRSLEQRGLLARRLAALRRRPRHQRVQVARAGDHLRRELVAIGHRLDGCAQQRDETARRRLTPDALRRRGPALAWALRAPADRGDDPAPVAIDRPRREPTNAA